MKQRALSILVVLVVGAVLNIGVAWFIADITDIDPSRTHFILSPDPDSSDQWFVTVTRGRGYLDVTAGISLLSSDPVRITDDRIPSWSRLRELPSYHEGDPMPLMHDLAFGWPALAMSYSIDATRAANTGTVISRTASGAFTDFEYPLRILWIGFVFNSVLYATVLSLLIIGTGTLRRRWRRSHGRCPACAYPCGSSGRCSECGAPVSQARVA